MRRLCRGYLRDEASDSIPDDIPMACSLGVGTMTLALIGSWIAFGSRRRRFDSVHLGTMIIFNTSRFEARPLVAIGRQLSVVIVCQTHNWATYW